MPCPPCQPRHGRPDGAKGWDNLGGGARRGWGALPRGEQAGLPPGHRPSGHPSRTGDAPSAPRAWEPCWAGERCQGSTSQRGLAPHGADSRWLNEQEPGLLCWAPCSAGRSDGESRAQPALQRAGKSRSGLALKGGTEPRSRRLPSEATEQRRLPEPSADAGNWRPGNIRAHPQHPRPGSCGGRGHPRVPLPVWAAVHAIPRFAGKWL